MAILTVTQTYCTSDHVRFILSQPGLTALVDEDESGVASVLEEVDITTAIDWAAASEINGQVSYQYKLADVTGNVALQMANALFAAEQLCQRRNNPLPSVLAARCDKARKFLNEVRWGRQHLPEQNASFNTLPTVSNFIPVLGASGRVAVDQWNSTGSAPVDGLSPRFTSFFYGGYYF